MFIIRLHYIVPIGGIAMVANALVQTRIDAEVRDRASAVLASMGLTVSDAVRILLTRTANEGSLPLELLTSNEGHDAWFRSKVLEALNNTRPDIPDDEAEIHFAERRAAVQRRVGDPKT
jgi:DNA-damage-inducible protein J